MTVYVLGGGPSGLAIADGLVNDSDISFTVVERDSALGGLAQTVKWGDHGHHDLGPHKIFTLDDELMRKVEGLLPDGQWLTRPKKSSIYMKQHFLPYPPSPFSLVGIYGPVAFSGMVVDYASARVRSIFFKSEARTFEEDLLGRLGKGIYEALFKPIALKLWGDPLHLDAKLSKGRVQTPSLVEVVGRMLKIKSASEFEALEFRYPRGGLQKLWDAIKSKSSDQGTFLLNSEVTSLKTNDNRVTSIRCKDTNTAEFRDIKISEDDFVFSTLPLGSLPGLMGDVIPPNIAQRINETVQLNDLILVFLKVDKKSLLDECWIFVPDKDVVFHRLSEQESFDPEMAVDGSIVCCEIMSNTIRPMSERTNDELTELSIKGLRDMGYKGFEVLDTRVIRLPSSYPVFRPGFEPKLERILKEFDRFDNFRTVGRQGAFNYIGTLDAMDIGYGAATWVINKDKPDSDNRWKEERRRTSHYPVLD